MEVKMEEWTHAPEVRRPFIAVTSPAFERIFTSCCLSRGSVRANTMPPREAVSSASRFFSGSAKNSAPVNDLFFRDSPLVKMPISFAIASAVGCVSPVIITTRIPAV
jgi:hypothetical protein